MASNKRPKMDHASDTPICGQIQQACDDDSTNTSDRVFDGFQVNRILSNNSHNKVVMVHGSFVKDMKNDDGHSKEAVVILEKNAFTQSEVEHILSANSTLKETLLNDIYHTYECCTIPEVNKIKTTLIYPATERHIQKYTDQESYVVQETSQDYNTITLPYLNTHNFSIQWVYNILDHKKESERIVFEDPDTEKGFILLPDMKWDLKDTDSMYLVAICHKRGLKSVRDLTSQHIPLLQNILHKGQDAIKEKYGIPAWKLRIYFHYQPSYNHLHVHFTHIKFDAPGSGCERAHLLSDVLDNIERDSSYYQTKTLTYVLRENDMLFKEYKKTGRY